jgi:hypothetical protein
LSYDDHVDIPKPPSISVLKLPGFIQVKVEWAMSNEQDANANRIENEPEKTEELTAEELDQVVGGTDPKPTPPPKQTYLVVTLDNTMISSYSDK